MLPDAHYFFGDEIGDGNDNILRSMLGVLNERVFNRGSQRIKCNLNTAILTSNMGLDREILRAFRDRIIFKARIQPIKKRESRIALYKHALDSPVIKMNKVLDQSQIELLQNALYRVKVPEETLQIFDTVIDTFVTLNPGTLISDRRRVDLLKIIRASALLDGRMFCVGEDCEKLRFGLLTINDEQMEMSFAKCYDEVIKRMAETLKKYKEYMKRRTGYNKNANDVYRNALQSKDPAEVTKILADFNEIIIPSFESHVIDTQGNKELNDGYDEILKDAKQKVEDISKALETLTKVKTT